MRYSQTSHTGYDPTTRTTIFQSRRYSATSWEVLVVLETKATFYWHHSGKILFQKSLIKNIFSMVFFSPFNFLFFFFFNSLTWSLGEHLTMFSGRSQAGSVESSDLDEVMRVWQHVLQPGLVDCCGDEYTVCSRLWIVVLPPILNLQDSEGDIVMLRAAAMWLKTVPNVVPGTPRCIAAGLCQCPSLATTRPELQWRTPVGHTHLLEALLALKSQKSVQLIKVILATPRRSINILNPSHHLVDNR